MKLSRCPGARPPKVMWMFFSSMCVSVWFTPVLGAKPRCGSDLLEDLRFVCGDRGIYFGRGSWSGYGSRPRGRGIVEKCCLSPFGCELHHLEKYCGKPASQSTTIAPTTTTTTTTTTAAGSSTLLHKAQQPSVFLQRLSEHVARSGSQRKDAYKKKTRKSKSTSSHTRTISTRRHKTSV